jgi:hypothetical protein
MRKSEVTQLEKQETNKVENAYRAQRECSRGNIRWPPATAGGCVRALRQDEKLPLAHERSTLP